MKTSIYILITLIMMGCILSEDKTKGVKKEETSETKALTTDTPSNNLISNPTHLKNHVYYVPENCVDGEDQYRWYMPPEVPEYWAIKMITYYKRNENSSVLTAQSQWMNNAYIDGLGFMFLCGSTYHIYWE